MSDREMAEDWDDELGGMVWVRGVDYMPEWYAALEAAAEVNAALVAAGLERRELRAVASTDEDGHAVVRLRGTPQGARFAAAVLWRGLA
ncbi:hypothetical protein HRW16_07160 [Streptomyces lunaelactis]|uniref:hypothetical protein n=1 Tax=Streptomyces lunaelactis TaxID=1535768 RepID=UPI001585C009|nr:hypothetical protein [Streptomyces lunaelactis]NUK01729.1 hypothetical protein [Streptomyces lunaelactis]NUK34572.1 hypothetical protein [Streptomyces lunaelactis]NUK42225.1 hypothetical protein [Streptomyces lunaelactis]NUK91652.1 hypothetical protein [Streptomyces lunaelactis]NUL31114.1 hypothetical protein [Streptomyces lunaelactis]